MYKIFPLAILFMVLVSCKNDAKNSGQSASTQDVKDISIEEAITLMTRPDIVTIDIRTPDEIAKGKILNSALEMDFYGDNFKNQLSNLDKEAKYVVYCRSGGRSGKTLKMMKQMEFQTAYNVLGGINEYKEKFGEEPISE